MAIFGHLIFIVLHILALCSLGAGLVITIPLHIIFTVMISMANKPQLIQVIGADGRPTTQAVQAKGGGKLGAAVAVLAAGVLLGIALLVIATVASTTRPATTPAGSPPAATAQAVTPAVETPDEPTAPQTEAQEEPASEEIIHMARFAVRRALAEPNSAEFPLPDSGGYRVEKSGDRTYTVMGSVTAKNALGVRVRQPWEVIVRFDGAEDVTPLYIELGQDVLLDNRPHSGTDQ